MTAPLLALSLSNTLLKVGALAAFAGLVGIAILSLLVFSQARELKRLREWAGRAPERAAELEQRVSAEAAARLQRVVAPQRVGGTPVPRATPMVTRVTPAAGPPTAVAADGTPVPVATGAPPAGQVPPPGGQPVPALPPGQLAPASAGQPAVDQPTPVSASGSAETPATSPPPLAAPTQPAAAPQPGQPAFVPTAAQSSPPTAGQPGVPVAQQSAVAHSGEGEPEKDAAPAAEDLGRVPAPATVGGAAARQAATGLPPAEPAADDTQPPTGQAAVLAPAAAAVAPSAERVAKGATGLSEDTDSPPVAGVPTPATVAARTVPAAGRAPAPPAGGRSATLPPRPARPAPPVDAAAVAAPRGIPGKPVGGGGGTSRPGGPRAGRAPGPPFLQEERSSGRTTALIVGGVVVGVAVLAGVLLSLGGGSHKNATVGSTTSHSAPAGGHGRSGSHRAHAVAGPAETHVVVLNSTETTGLAHRLSANLRQSGYTQSAALDGHPTLRASSVVEYAGGHRTEALHVGQTLGISQVQPLEGAIVPLVGSATVVVIAGSDQAAVSSGGAAESGSGASGTGEPSASTEAPAGGETAAGGEAAGGAAQ
jgi:hypothetical protein